MKKSRRRMTTPQHFVKCLGCKRTSFRYEYGYRGRIRWKKPATKPTPLMHCICGGQVERTPLPHK